MDKKEEEDPDYRYKQLQQKKQECFGQMVQDAKQMKQDVKQLGGMIDEDNQNLNNVNNRVQGLTNRGERSLNKMQRYLENTSNCKIYVILGIELFIFIALMSL